MRERHCVCIHISRTHTHTHTHTHPVRARSFRATAALLERVRGGGVDFVRIEAATEAATEVCRGATRLSSPTSPCVCARILTLFNYVLLNYAPTAHY